MSIIKTATYFYKCHLESLSVLTAIFPGEPGLASFAEAKDDGSGGDSWTSPSTTQHPTLFRM